MSLQWKVPANWKQGKKKKKAANKLLTYKAENLFFKDLPFSKELA